MTLPAEATEPVEPRTAGCGGGHSGCAAGTSARPAEFYTGCELPRDEALLGSGWQWRSNIDPSRAAELVATYEQLGFEVRLEPIALDRLSPACRPCAPLLRQASGVYIRKTR